MNPLPILINLASYQAIWWLAALQIVPTLYLFVLSAILLAIHLSVIRTARKQELGLVLIFATLGYLIDSQILASRIFEFKTESSLWLFAVWIQFMTTISMSLKSIMLRPILGPTLAAVFGPLSYWAAEKLGVLSYQEPLFQNLAIHGLIWLGIGWTIQRIYNRHLATKGLLKIGAATGLAAMITGCTSAPLAPYRGSSPQIKFEEFFNGNLVAKGAFFNRSGEVMRRFEIKLKGTFDDKNGTLEEDFVYDDGEKQRRVWTIEKNSQGEWVGTADDIVGPATKSSEGYALLWKYTMRLNVKGAVYNMNFDDFMYQLDSKTVLNKSKMSKWGIYLGEVVLFITKEETNQ